MSSHYQLDLFTEQNLNVVSEIKRQIRLALSKTNLSRDQVVDQMNDLAIKNNLKRVVTKTALDSWCKDSDPGRMPTVTGLVLFCRILSTIDPIRALTRPLGCEVIEPEEKKILAWGKAEIFKKRAAKKAKLAMEVLEINGI